MGSPIAAGSIVAVRADISAFELVARRPLLGICESAVAPGAPGDPPTNVVVAWEDGTRVTYPAAFGLVSVTLPSVGGNLLGTVMQFGGPGTILPVPILEAGTRVRGPVVMHVEFFEANGDPVGASAGEQNVVVVIQTQFGYAAFLRIGMSVVPNA